MAPLVQLVNFGLALLMWLIIGGAALRVLTGGRQSPVQALFDRATQPLFALTRRAFPFVGGAWLPLVTLLALGALRLGLVVLTHRAPGR